MSPKVYLLIRFFDDQSITSGVIEFQKNFLSEIKEFYPSINELSANLIAGAIGVLAKKASDSEPARQLNIRSFVYSPTKLRIEFVVDSQLKITSGSFKKRTWAVLAGAGLAKKDQFLPLCVVLTSEQFDAINNPPQKSPRKVDDPLLQELLQMKKEGQWLSIMNKFSPIDSLSKNHPRVWNDAKLVSEIGFALGKLAETSPRDIPRDEPARTNFLRQQDKYRTLTQIIRKRCIELRPDTPSYYSDLAYLHYLNAIEISLPRGRKGKVTAEVNEAIANIDKALSLDSNRLKDLYRKGYLLTHILPKQIIFGGQDRDSDFQTRSSEAEVQKANGIEAFLKVISIWESLPAGDFKKVRFRSDYLKTLYSLGDTYHDSIFTKWDEALFALDLREDVAPTDRPVFYQKDLEKLDKSWDCFHKCWQLTRTDPSSNSVVDDVYLLYSMGKVLLSKYWLLSGEGQVNSPDVLEILSRSIRALEKALETPWSQQNQTQKKDFIAERLARAYIAKGEPQRAITIINKHRGKRLDAYIANTLALALHSCNKHNEAREVLRDAINNKGNKEIWLSHFLMGCSYLKEGNSKKASEVLEVSRAEAQKVGKDNVDGLLVGQAFCAYKSNELVPAIGFLQEAVTMNPYRYSVQRRLEKWKAEAK